MNRYRFYEILQAHKNGDDLSSFIPKNAPEAALISDLKGGSGNGGVSPLKKFFDGKPLQNYLFNGYQFDNIDGIIQYDDTSNVTQMDSFFDDCPNLKSVPLFDMRKVTSTYYMFANCPALESIPEFDTSSVEDARNMYEGCSSLKKIKQNLDSATSLSGFAKNCTSLEILDITRFYSSSASNAMNFAANCAALKALVIRGFGDAYELHTGSFAGSGIAAGTGYVYVPREYVDILKAKTNWSTYASQFRALEDYTVDGTTTGELDESKI